MRAKRKTKLRKSTRYFYIVVATVLLIVSSTSLMQTLLKKNINNSKKEIYSYQNQFNYTYIVNLKNNKYIDEESLDMGKAYITDLIDNIDLNLNYKYTGNASSDIVYTYSVLGKIQASYTEDGEEQKVWEKNYILLEERTNKENTDKINIDEQIKLDLKKENELVKDFEQEMNMNLDAIYTIIFEVNTSTNIEGKPVKNKYVSTMAVDLAEKTTKISGENGKKETEYVTKEIIEDVDVNVLVIIMNIGLLIVSTMIYRYVFTKTIVMNKIKNDYRKELNRILRLCQEKIVQINSCVDIEKENIIDVKDFGEIIKVSEELFKPILYWESKEAEEAWFIVMSNHISYRYILKK